MDGSNQQQFEQAVLVSFNQGVDQSYRNAALASLEQLKRSEGCWRVCVQALLGTAHSEVQFWCLQTLCEFVQAGGYAAFGADDVSQLQNAIMGWLERLPAEEPPFIKNKLAQLLVAMLEVDYPERWPHFFARLLAFLSSGSPGATDLFLRVLSTLHEELLSAESGARTPERLPTANRVKDAMRAGPINHVVEAWYAIMAQAGTSEEHLALADRALRVLRPYVGWADVGLVANDRVMPLLLQFAWEEHLHEGACGVLTEVVVKGMEPAAKLAHLRKLGLTAALAALADRQQGGPARRVPAPGHARLRHRPGAAGLLGAPAGHGRGRGGGSLRGPAGRDPARARRPRVERHAGVPDYPPFPERLFAAPPPRGGAPGGARACGGAPPAARARAHPAPVLPERLQL
mmetsp:Transcript_21167/g.71132  ORF Transcript_21167/g.71132 Transcript_21167/m.71132 type:complete len:402 (+) Transcript_21167:56-1261(+)